MPGGLVNFCGRSFPYDEKSSPEDAGFWSIRQSSFATIQSCRKPAIDVAHLARVEFIALYSYQLGKPYERRMPCEAHEAEADKKRMLFDEADVS